MARGAFSQGAVDYGQQRVRVLHRQHPDSHEVLVVPQEKRALGHLAQGGEKQPSSFGVLCRGGGLRRSHGD